MELRRLRFHASHCIVECIAVKSNRYVGNDSLAMSLPSLASTKLFKGQRMFTRQEREGDF